MLGLERTIPDFGTYKHWQRHIGTSTQRINVKKSVSVLSVAYLYKKVPQNRHRQVYKSVQMLLYKNRQFYFYIVLKRQLFISIHIKYSKIYTTVPSNIEAFWNVLSIILVRGCSLGGIVLQAACIHWHVTANVVLQQQQKRKRALHTQNVYSEKEWISVYSKGKLTCGPMCPVLQCCNYSSQYYTYCC